MQLPSPSPHIKAPCALKKKTEILPSKRTLTRPLVSGERACCINSSPSSKISATGVPQLIIPCEISLSTASALVPNA